MKKLFIKMECLIFGHDHKDIDRVATCSCGHIDWNKTVEYMANEVFMNKIRKIHKNQ